MTPEAVQQGGHIAYLREADEALRRVIAGEAQMAMLVRAIPARTVCEVARSGGVMPQSDGFLSQAAERADDLCNRRIAAQPLFSSPFQRSVLRRAVYRVIFSRVVAFSSA